MTGKGDLPYGLENMSVPELEALLQQDFIASNGSAPDVDYIMAIMEVIQKKERALPNYQPTDAEKAWEAFQSFYNTEEGRTSSIYRSEEESEAENTVPQVAANRFGEKKPSRARRRLITAILIAALLAATMIPVSGYANVIQMVIAYWTDDYFSFTPGHGNSAMGAQDGALIIPEGFEDLWACAQKNQIQNLMIPQYIPDGFQVADTILNEYSLTDGFEFYIMLTKNDDYIDITIIKNGNNPRTVYEKDTSAVTAYEINGIEYYIFSNNGEQVSTLYYDDIEYLFGTTLTEHELKQIIDSMFEE